MDDRKDEGGVKKNQEERLTFSDEADRKLEGGKVEEREKVGTGWRESERRARPPPRIQTQSKQAS